MKLASVKEIKNFFKMSLQELKEEWEKLSNSDKQFFRVEIGKLKEIE